MTLIAWGKTGFRKGEASESSIEGSIRGSYVDTSGVSRMHITIDSYNILREWTES